MESTHTVDELDVNPESEFDFALRKETAVLILDPHNDADPAIMESSVVARSSLLNDVDEVSWFHGPPGFVGVSILTRSSA